MVHNVDCSVWARKIVEYEQIALDKVGHLDAARREITGEVVAYKADGVTPFDHVMEVSNIQNGLRNMILDLQSQLRSGKLSPQETTQAQALLSRASKALDYSEKYVPKGSKAGWKP